MKAIYINGVFMPVDSIDLEEGTEDGVSGEPVAPVGLTAVLKAAKELHETVPPQAWDALPTDLAKNKKQYLYGHPKVDSG